VRFAQNKTSPSSEKVSVARAKKRRDAISITNANVARITRNERHGRKGRRG
jgi:hypothetical protein